MLSTTLVLSYVHVFPPSYRLIPSVGLPTVTSLPSANVLDKVAAAVGATLVIGTVQRTTGGASLVFTTDAANTDIFETKTTEKTVLAHVWFLVLPLKNQPPQPTNQQSNQQVSVQSASTVYSPRSAPAYTISPPPSIIRGYANDIDAGPNLLKT